MNLKESLQLIQETAIKAAEAKIVRIPGDERQAYIDVGGSLTKVELPPPSIKYAVSEFDDLVSLATGHGEVATLWHNESAIVLLLDAADRRDRATMTLTPTGVWKWLKSLRSDGAKFNQRDLIRFVRTTLDGALEPGAAETLLSSLRAVTFRRSDSASAEIERGKNTLGKSVEESCTGIDKLPENINVKVQAYANVDGLPEASVSLLIDVDFDSQSFALIPIGDAVAIAEKTVQRAIGLKLNDEANGVAVYAGTP